MLIDLIAGARPNFMKVAPLIRALETRAAAGGPLRYRLVHTGQHYDPRLSGAFFEQLGIPAPDVNLEVGSGTQAEQTAAIMTRYERLLLEAPSKLCLVVGDVTSTMACAIAAQKLGVPVAHVEGGIRSGDWTMPEEINRMVTDSITNWFFTTSEFANANLRRAGVGEERIFFVGNTMIDTLLAHLDRLRPPGFWGALGLRPGEYLVMTLHRPANVDQAATLQRLLAAIAAGARGLPVLFPVHPRTAKVITETLGKQALPSYRPESQHPVPPPSFRPGSRNPVPGTATEPVAATEHAPSPFRPGSQHPEPPPSFRPGSRNPVPGTATEPVAATEPVTAAQYLPDFPNILLVEPQPYLEFNYLVKHAKAVITDSGGITEETTVLGVPCLTLRDTTERPETVSIGTNALIGTEPAKLAPALERLFAGNWPTGGIPPFWDGRTGERIVAALERVLNSGH